MQLQPDARLLKGGQALHTQSEYLVNAHDLPLLPAAQSALPVCQEPVHIELEEVGIRLRLVDWHAHD